MPRDTEKFNYYHSGILDLDYAVHKTTGEHYFLDNGVTIKYNQDEIKIIRALNADTTRTRDEKAAQIKRLHELKKMFSGKVVTEEDIK